MENKQETKLVPFTIEEGKLVQADVDAALAKHEAELVVTPVIDEKGCIKVLVQAFKKVAPVETGIPSPAEFLTPNTDGGNDTTKAN